VYFEKDTWVTSARAVPVGAERERAGREVGETARCAPVVEEETSCCAPAIAEEPTYCTVAVAKGEVARCAAEVAP
jgi:hypothetical protein